MRESKPVSGAKRLQYACMIDALHNTLSNQPDIKKEAVQWFDSTDTHLFSFFNCCETFDLDPDTVREAVRMSTWDPKVHKTRALK